MKLVLDPYMQRHLSLPDIARATAGYGFDGIELSPRADFLDWWVMPRATSQRVRDFRKALRDNGTELTTLQPMYRWSSPIEEERQAAMRYWRRAIEIASEMECRIMVSEFGRGTSPERAAGLPPGVATPETCEAAFWRSMDDLVPLLERSGIMLSLEPHPEDWVETFHPAIDIIRNIGSDAVRMSYIVPHTFFYGEDMAAMLREAADILVHIRVADTFDHRKSSELRYIVNPPGAKVRVHQHLDIGQGEIDWTTFFDTLAEIRFDGVLSSCVFAWEDRAEDSTRFMLSTMRKELTQRGMM
ncbi:MULTISPECIES: sugar phosphate isomerase/epimerase family protein [Asaia]|uniref:Glyceraldehyde-3-phosphate ketol-isomerase n=1 Tax=Asaia bogorensis TaxID=91915 RepID=A0A060QLS2_9PROT|nr:MULTISPECIES: sugar phosphate isomerase/epimerase [Asaia]ETC97311.1 protein iolH [Asaia sp. SF2.1]MDL2170900.1 sugar phosphate isomerase/epimerase [Asaia sp. HumB]CDG40582.1 Glyceraldehyde-3-phosphate ketol-isomerase [Asaia bogorensis]